MQARLTTCLSRLVEKASKDGKVFPDKVKVKLTGDGTKTTRGLNVVNIAFTMVENSRAQFASGNHIFAIL